MNNKILSICCILAGLLLYGCPPPKQDIGAEQGSCEVSNVIVDVNDKMMNISWENNCENTIAGYNIYISKENNSNGPYNDVPFDGDTDPLDGVEHFKAYQLENGVRYYVSVAIVNPDQTESKRSQDILTVCGPREEIELSVRYKSENDGYSFDQNNYVRADSDKNDLYYYSTDGVDYLASPAQLGGFMRDSQFATLKYRGEFQELKENISKYKKIPTDKKISVKVNDWILIENEDHKHALAQVLGFSGSGEDRKIELFIAYAPIWGDLIF